MQTSDPNLLFQTDSDLAKAANYDVKRIAAREHGQPIETGKVIDLILEGDDAITAESGWQARRICLRTGKTKTRFVGHRGPVTSVAVLASRYLFTASWDKTIKVWNLTDGALLFTLEGHTDFVKSVLVIDGPKPQLSSTSSDRTIRSWNLSPLLLGQQPVLVSTVRDHTRPVECSSLSLAPPATLYTADSLGVLISWELKDGKLQLLQSTKPHETSIVNLSITEDGLWTASMDNYAMLVVSGRISERLHHSTYVRSVLAIPDDMSPRQQLVLTGSDDEKIHVWDLSSEQRPPPHWTVEGHCGPVTSLQAWKSINGQWKVVSADLDGTIRQWTLDDIVHPKPLVFTVQKTSDHGMTEEEERELAELMSDED